MSTDVKYFWSDINGGTLPVCFINISGSQRDQVHSKVLPKYFWLSNYSSCLFLAWNSEIFQRCSSNFHSVQLTMLNAFIHIFSKLLLCLPIRTWGLCRKAVTWSPGTPLSPRIPGLSARKERKEGGGLLPLLLLCSPSSCWCCWPPSPASGLDAKRGVRDEEEGRELLAEGELKGMVERVEGREVKS